MRPRCRSPVRSAGLMRFGSKAHVNGIDVRPKAVNMTSCTASKRSHTAAAPGAGQDFFPMGRSGGSQPGSQQVPRRCRTRGRPQRSAGPARHLKALSLITHSETETSSCESERRLRARSELAGLALPTAQITRSRVRRAATHGGTGRRGSWSTRRGGSRFRVGPVLVWSCGATRGAGACGVQRLRG
jgi:hypothetical protein